jgi:3-methylcrotonyl-CoA carboxylase alpha subunit
VPQGLDLAAAALGAQILLTRESVRIAMSNEREPDEPASPWDAADGFQLAGARRLGLPILAGGENVVAEVVHGGGGPAVTVNGIAQASDAVVVTASDAVYVLRKGRQTKVALRDLNLDEAGDGSANGLVRAPMHGKVLGILVEKGDHVTRGQRLAIIEAMKMEHTLVAPMDGIVAQIAVAQDAQVSEGAKVMVIEISKE